MDKENMYQDFTLLVDGKEAFPEIINCINNAKKSVNINMFIWRDDNIGNEIAEVVLKAANRGVNVNISVDRYGVVLEKSEESKKSFFHKKQSIIEKTKSKVLELVYPMKNAPKNVKDEYSDLYKEIMNHKNIKVNKDEFKADHSKYYIIDDEILIMGGINIEDKENGKDMQGRVYQDYMVKLNGKEYVDNFMDKINNKVNSSEDYFFGVNIKKNNKKELFEMEKLYLDMIKESKKELTITMAYFSLLENFHKEIINAYKRGVKVRIMIPGNANYQDDTNKRTIKKLMMECDNNIDVYLSKKMVHTKMMINDEYISMGSTNITKKAFNQLNELNLFIKNVKSKFRDHLLESVEENYKLADKIDSYKSIKYNKLMAKVESILV